MLTKKEALVAAKRAREYPEGYGFAWGTDVALRSNLQPNEIARAIQTRPSLIGLG